VNAVAARLRADIDDGKADAFGGGREDAVRIHKADAHGVDKNVVVVAGVEIRFAADRRHAHTVAVVADPGDDAGQKMPRLGMVGRAEAQRIHIGNGARAHGEHVAHDTAHARRRALIGLNIGGVVMALHLEDRRLVVAEIDDAGILAGPLDDLWPRRRQCLQPDA
jgi:hypothetical protein